MLFQCYAVTCKISLLTAVFIALATIEQEFPPLSLIEERQ